MDKLEFLRTIFPPSGHYCVVTPFTPAGAAKPIYAHKVFDDVQDLARFSERKCQDQDVYFSVLTLKAPSVWNPSKKNLKTGELGAREYRTHTNMAEAKCFFLDLDVGKSTTKVKKFASQEEAASALKAFCRDTGLPRPIVVSSGVGLHIYWPLATPLPADDWAGYAGLLQRLVNAQGLAADPSRIVDRSSVLRVPDTFNHKKGQKLPVKVEIEGSTTDTLEFVQRLKTACAKFKLSEEIRVKTPMDNGQSGIEYSGRVPSLEGLLDSCKLMRAVHEHGGDWSYEQWHKALAVFRCVEDGRKVSHEWSARDYGHYDQSEADAKLDDQERQGIGPTSCEVMQSVFGDQHCAGCPSFGKVKGPVSAALAPQPAANPVLVPPAFAEAEPPEPIEIKPPEGYIRAKNGGIFLVVEKKDDEGEKFTMHVPVLDYDLYPTIQQVDDLAGSDQHVWVAKLPRQGVKIFTLDSHVIQDGRELATELSKRSVYVAPGKIKLVQDYMSAYTRYLQKLADAQDQKSRLGWHDDYKSFCIGDKMLCADGSTLPVHYSGNAATVVSRRGLRRAGSLERQIELLKFYDRPHLIRHQYYILNSLAAPLFHMTGYHGCIVNMLGRKGGGKSAALAAGMSFWGNPVTAYLSGVDKQGVTAKTRDEYMATLCNLPVGLDEISNIAEDAAKAFAYAVSQPGDRERLDGKGRIIVRPGGAAEGDMGKSTIMMTNSNKSLHGLLAEDNSMGDASSMRVVEVEVPPLGAKGEADDFMYHLKKNYGHIGEVFMRFVVTHYHEVEALVRDLVKKIDTATGLSPGERFWAANIAAVLAACIIANRLGLLAFDWKKLRDWAVKELVPKMQGVVAEEYITPLSFLTGLINDVMPECVFVSSKAGNLYNDRVPQNGIAARYEAGNRQMWVTLDRVKLQANRKKIPYKEFISELMEMKLILDKNVRVTLAKGTEYEAARAYTYLIDMSREELVGKAEDAEKKVRAEHLKVIK